MRILDRLSVRSKLVVLMVPALVPMCLFAWIVLDDLWVTKQGANDLSAATTVASAAADLVHEVQVERGMTAGFLGSGGTKFADELVEQRENTDRQLRNLRAVLDRTELVGEEPRDAIARLSGHLERLDRTRSAVDAQSIEATAAIGYYTQGNNMMLDLMRMTSANAMRGDVARVAQVSYRFMLAKEAAGIERAVLTGAAVRGRFDDAAFQRFVSLLAVQESHLAFFVSTAPEPVVQQWRAIEKADYVRQTTAARKLALAATTGASLSIEPTVWFEQQTAKISAMRDIEATLVSQLHELAESNAAAAARQLTVWTIVTIVSVLGTLLIGFQVFREVVSAVRESLSVAEAISVGRLDVSIQVRGRDEFTKLGQAMTTMQERLSATRAPAPRRLRRGPQLGHRSVEQQRHPVPPCHRAGRRRAGARVVHGRDRLHHARGRRERPASGRHREPIRP